MKPERQYTTIKLRVSDRHAASLRRKARAVNFVWNYCNETQMKAAKAGRPWLGSYELQKLTAGAGTMLGLHASSVAAICTLYVQNRIRYRKAWLRFRTKKTIGWVPFKGRDLKKRGGAFVYHGVSYRTLHDRPESEAEKYSAGSFNADARGRWYINVCVPAPERVASKEGSVGIDLGLKQLAALSNGEKIANPKNLDRLAGRLATAQRAGKKRQAANLYARIKNARSDFLHKLSHQLATNYNLIVVGNVSSKSLVKTCLAKSVLDAGWSKLRRQLSYKAVWHGGCYAEVSEYLTTQSCSSCGCLPPERPRGLAGIGIRQWQCSSCGTVHDRDVNAAKNILARFSQKAPAEGAPQSRGADDFSKSMVRQ